MRDMQGVLCRLSFFFTACVDGCGEQVKLLRVLQECEVVRVAARKAIPLNVRVVAATNADLAHAVPIRRFRQTVRLLGMLRHALRTLLKQMGLDQCSGALDTGRARKLHREKRRDGK